MLVLLLPGDLIIFNPDHLETSSLKGSVPVSTIKTGIDKRDKDLKKETYFDADKYKTIELSSTKLYKKDNHFAGTFHVTIKGITKQVEIPFTFTQTGKEAEFAGSFTINRRDYGVGGSSIMMSDDLTVSITIKARE
jgi:polyisoprenoid-binding protein YceI